MGGSQPHDQHHIWALSTSRAALLVVVPIQECAMKAKEVDMKALHCKPSLLLHLTVNAEQ